jgi:4-amino-4-deoxy-L-arabinose transferase-like glycosyltransferase
MSAKNHFLNVSALKRNSFVLFLLILIAHLGFKVLYLNNSGFWYSEAFNVFYSEQDWGLIKHTSDWNRNAPLYYYFLSIWRSLFGIGEVAIRLSSVIFSSLSAALLYILLRKHFNGVTAFIALILFTFSNDMYAASQEANVDPLIVFLVIASFYFFFNLIDKKSAFSVILLGICNFLMVYGLYITIIIPVMQILIVLIFFRKQIFTSVGFAFLITIVMTVLRVTPKSMNLIFHPENGKELAEPTLYYLKFICYSLFNGEGFFWIFGGICVLSIFWLLFTRRLIYTEKSKNIKFGSILLVGVGGIFACFYLYFLMPEFSKNYFLFVLPFSYALIAVLISKFDDEIRYSIVGAVVFLGFCTFTKMNLNVKKSMDYRNAMGVVKNLQKPGTLVLVETRDVGFLFAYYYDRNAFTDFKEMESKLKEKNVYFVSSLDDIKNIDICNYKRVIITQTFENVNPENWPMIGYIVDKYGFYSHSRRYSEVGLFLIE